MKTLCVLAALAIVLSACAASATPEPTAVPSITRTPPPSTPPTPTPWQIRGGAGTNYRALHMGGNWGTNRDGGVEELSPEYFEWLRELNVNWVGISVAIYVDDSMDSSVERKYSGVEFPTFTDETLEKLIGAFRQHGFHVYLTLAFEDVHSESAAHPVQRWQLGDPDIYNESPEVLPEFWPWALEHPDHDRYVAEFWQTYTEQAVYFGQIAEQTGVELYSLGTETDRLIRTTPGGVGSNDFLEEVRAMVEAVRAVYPGPITFDRHGDTLLHADFFGGDSIWQDAGFDVIGVSAYFRLAETPPTTLITVEEFESRWESIFADQLIPLHANHPGKPILFTEFGYTDSLGSPFDAAVDEYAERVLQDADGNGLDDGQEMQANIILALFNVMDRHPGVLQGVFLWGNQMASDAQWSAFFGQHRGFDIRDKLAEQVVRDRYGAWRDAP